MTLPTSKILKANKSLVATASLKHMSPSYDNSQQQSVSIVVNNSSPDLTKKVSYPDVEQLDKIVEPTTRDIGTITDEEENPYKSLATRDLQSAKANTEELSKIINEKENIIKAQAIIIDMFQHNPLIINKYIIATQDTLTELIKLLTYAETVEIELNDIECTCTTPKFAIIKKIFLTVKGEIYSIELCPVVLRLFETYKISLNLVAI